MHALSRRIMFAGATWSFALAGVAIGQDGPPTAGARRTPGLRLPDVLRCAETDHPLIRASDAQVGSARARRAAAGALPNPIVTYQRENGGFGGGAPPAGLSVETSIYGTLPLESLYLRWPRLRVGSAEIRSAEAMRVATKRQVLLEAARAFFRVALAQEGVTTAREVFQRLESLARYNQDRVAAGVSAEADLIRVRVEAGRAGAAVTLGLVELARARGALAPFLATCASIGGVDSIAVNAEANETASAPLPSLHDFAPQALASRPDVLVARARVDAAAGQADLERRLFLRQVGIVFGTKRIEGVNTMIAGFTLPAPIFDQNLSGRRLAATERIGAEEQLAWAERIAKSEIEATYRAAALLDQELRRLSPAFLARADESRRLTLAAYEEGAATLLQVLDASRSLAEATLDFHRTAFAYRESLVELALAVGLDPAAPRPAESPAGPSSPHGAPQ